MADTTGEAVWDSDPVEAVERELPQFLPHVDGALPVIDVGCGNGRQTFALAERLPRVLGVDLSAEAICGAQRLYVRDNLEFRVLDLLEPGAAAALHNELGDANVYVRTVLHQLSAADRPAAVSALSTLVGDTGAAFVVELAPAAWGSAAEDPAQAPPKLARVLEHGVTPGSLEPDELASLFAAEGLRVVFSESSTIVTTQQSSRGDPVEVPCDKWLLARG